LVDPTQPDWPKRLLGAALAALLAVLTLAATPATAQAAKYASLVMEADTGRVLYERNADTRVYPASLTKMMTLYLLFEALEKGEVKLTTPMAVSRRAAGQPPSKIGVKAGSTIRVDDAIRILVIKSANDVATVVAEHLGGTEVDFARHMTAKARSLGMTRTTFRNASGLPNPAQMSTARDIATLSLALRRDFPQYYKYFALTQTTYGGQAIRTHNRVLLNYDGADGLKTGYIRASGFNLAASAQRDGVSLIGVVFGGKTSRWRDRHMMTLLDKGFDQARSLAALPAPARKPMALLASLDPDGTVIPVAPASDAQGDTDSADMGQTWGIQVGAYSAFSVATAQAATAADALTPLYADSHASVIPIQHGGGGLIYRARVLGLETEHQARDACAAIRDLANGCVVVTPGEATAALTGR
jgi:D-alanyl-D-alanine carboxypeptidase